MGMAILILTAIAGISLVIVLSSPVSRFFFAAFVLICVIVALVNGGSSMIESATITLGNFFARYPFSLIGLLFGFLLGLIFRRRRR